MTISALPERGDNITDTGGSRVLEYDRFAEVYEAWTGTSTAASNSALFYVDAYLQTTGVAVELGVGTGRIALEAARRGRNMIGVDASAEMLSRCRVRAEAAGLSQRLRLLEADFRDFELDHPAALIALPYHSIGHLTTADEKAAAVGHVFDQLAPGGRFIFDDFHYRPELAEQFRRVELKAELKHPETGLDTLLWATSLIDVPSQSLRLVTWTDEMDSGGELVRRQYRRLSLSWLEPQQWQEILVGAGFVIEDCFGDYARTPFDATQASDQLWVAVRPRASTT